MSAGHLTRRSALLLGAGVAGHAALAPMFITRAAPLAYRLEPQRLADGAWMVAGAQEAMTAANGGAIANVAILDSAEGAIVIDTGSSKRYGLALAALARELTGKPVVRAYLTHFHPDHIFGSQAFGGALASTAGVAEGIKALGDDFSAAMYHTVGDWMRGTEVEIPARIVAGASEEIGGRKLSFLSLGGHTPSDLAIVEERSGLLFTGDLVFLDRAPTTPHAELARWRASLATLGAVPHSKLVPGHGPAEPGARGIAQTRDWLEVIESTIRRSFEKGLDINEAFAEPLPAWTEKIALARYEFERSIMHLYPALEAGSWPRVDRKS